MDDAQAFGPPDGDVALRPSGAAGSVSRPRRSARIASMTRCAIRQVFDMRAMISGLAARYAAAEDVAALRDRQAVLAGLQRRDPAGAKAIYAQNCRLWLQLHAAPRTRNVTCITGSISGAGIWQIALRDRLSASEQTLSSQALAGDWAALIDAIETHDEDAADRLACDVSDLGGRRVEGVLPEGDDPAA